MSHRESLAEAAPPLLYALPLDERSLAFLQYRPKKVIVGEQPFVVGKVSEIFPAPVSTQNARSAGDSSVVRPAQANSKSSPCARPAL